MAHPGHSAEDLHEDADEAKAWIEAVTDLQKPEDQSFEEWLRSGVVLCTLLNALKPGSIKKISTSAMPFKQMESISLFLKGARTLGVQEFEVFDTNDLYRGTDLRKVVQCIYSLGTAVKKSGWTGPQLGVKIASPNKRDFSEQQLQEARSATTKLCVGSAGFTERSAVIKQGVTFGNDQSGSGAALASHQTMGSAASSERLEVVDRGITMGADAATRGPAGPDAAPAPVATDADAPGDAPTGAASVGNISTMDDAAFRETFGLDRGAYEALPQWKQIALKKKLGLF